MARKIFVSYKYGDTQTADIGGANNTCRDYVDVIMDKFADIEIYKGEEDENDLSTFKDETIRTQLKEKIRDSSITIVLISKGMRDDAKSERDQWIPWEVKYSLRRKAYGEKRSNSNGMLAVVIPDEFGSYAHYFEYSGCNHCSSRTHKKGELFEILGNNMFNKKSPVVSECPSPAHASSHHKGNDHSYIYQVEWHKFINSPSLHVDIAEDIRNNIDDYNLQKVVLS